MTITGFETSVNTTARKIPSSKEKYMEFSSKFSKIIGDLEKLATYKNLKSDAEQKKAKIKALQAMFKGMRSADLSQVYSYGVTNNSVDGANRILFDAMHERLSQLSNPRKAPDQHAAQKLEARLKAALHKHFQGA